MKSSTTECFITEFSYPFGIYLFKVIHWNTWTMSEIYPKLTIRTTERRLWRHFGDFIANFEHILQIVLDTPLLTLSKCQLGTKYRLGTNEQRQFRYFQIFKLSKNRSGEKPHTNFSWKNLNDPFQKDSKSSTMYTNFREM